MHLCKGIIYNFSLVATAGDNRVELLLTTHARNPPELRAWAAAIDDCEVPTSAPSIGGACGQVGTDLYHRVEVFYNQRG